MEKIIYLLIILSQYSFDGAIYSKLKQCNVCPLEHPLICEENLLLKSVNGNGYKSDYFEYPYL